MHLHINFQTSSVSLFFIFYHRHVNVWLNSHSHSNGFVLLNLHSTNVNFSWLRHIPTDHSPVHLAADIQLVSKHNRQNLCSASDRTFHTMHTQNFIRRWTSCVEHFACRLTTRDTIQCNQPATQVGRDHDALWLFVSGAPYKSSQLPSYSLTYYSSLHVHQRSN